MKTPPNSPLSKYSKTATPPPGIDQTKLQEIVGIAQEAVIGIRRTCAASLRIGLRLLTILMRESPRVVTRRDIEREIWGDGLPDSDTLRSHLYNLRKAIDRPFDKQLLHTVQTAGYRIADLDTAPAA